MYFYCDDSLYLWKYFLKKKKIFTPTQSLRVERAFQKSTAFSWPLILVIRLTLGLFLTHRVELPITDHYLITAHFFRSSSSVLYFEWFKMLWERYLSSCRNHLSSAKEMEHWKNSKKKNKLFNSQNTFYFIFSFLFFGPSYFQSF